MDVIQYESNLSIQPNVQVQQKSAPQAYSSPYSAYGAPATTPSIPAYKPISASSPYTTGPSSTTSLPSYPTSNYNNHSRPISRETGDGNIIPISALNPYTNKYVSHVKSNHVIIHMWNEYTQIHMCTLYYFIFF